MIAVKPHHRPETRSAATYRVAILSESAGLEQRLTAHCSTDRWRSYLFRTFSPDAEGIAAMKAIDPAALLAPYDLPGVSALDMFEALLGHELPPGFPAACYAPEFAQRDRERARALRSVKLLPAGDALPEAVTHWLQDVFVLAKIPPHELTEGQVCDLLWQRVAKRDVSELQDILPTGSEVTPEGGALCRVTYLKRRFRLLVRQGKVITVAIE